MYFVYVLKNTTNKIYIGQTENLTKRLKRHNGELISKTTSYTKKQRGNWNIIYSETFKTRNEAFVREKLLKSHKGRDWLRQIIPGL